MKKQPFDPVVMDVIVFDVADVIRTSPTTGGSTDKDQVILPTDWW